MMKDMERYRWATYSDIYQLYIITKTPETLLDPEMPTIIPEMVAACPKTDRKIIYLEKKNIKESICQKLRKKDF